MKYSEHTLGELCIGSKGRYGIGASAEPYGTTKYTYLRITDINDDGTLNTADLKSLNDPDAEKYLLSPGDIVFARTGASTGRSYYYEGTIPNMVFAGFLIKFTPDETKIYPKFLKYYCISNKYRNWVNGALTGSTRGNINEQTLRNMPVILPDLETQKKIVRVLSALDQKIELNIQENKNLESICEHLYKETIKNNNCNKTTIGNYSKVVITGGTPSTKNELFWGGNIPFVTIPDMHNKAFIANTERTITEAGATKSKITPKGSIIVSCIATVGLVGVAPLECQTNQQINSVVPKNLFDTYFLYETLKNKTEVLKAIGSTGSATLNVNKTAFSNVEIQIPSQEIIEQYHIKVSPLFEKIYKNEAENLTIVSLRDNLLPKLMSGEIDLGRTTL